MDLGVGWVPIIDFIRTQFPVLISWVPFFLLRTPHCPVLAGTWKCTIAEQPGDQGMLCVHQIMRFLGIWFLTMQGAYGLLHRIQELVETFPRVCDVAWALPAVLSFACNVAYQQASPHEYGWHGGSQWWEFFVQGRHPAKVYPWSPLPPRYWWCPP